MPSSAPTVSKRAGRAAQGRPEAWKFEGPRLLPAARAVEASGHVRRHPAMSSLLKWAAAEGEDQEPSFRCSLAAARGLRRRATARGSGLSGPAILSHDRPPSGFSNPRVA